MTQLVVAVVVAVDEAAAPVATAVAAAAVVAVVPAAVEAAAAAAAAAAAIVEAMNRVVQTGDGTRECHKCRDALRRYRTLQTSVLARVCAYLTVRLLELLTAQCI